MIENQMLLVGHVYVWLAVKIYFVNNSFALAAVELVVRGHER